MVVVAQVSKLKLILLDVFIISDAVALYVYVCLVNVQKVSCNHRPRAQSPVGIKRCEESIAFSPHKVVNLSFHANEVNSVFVREGHHHNCVDVEHE